MTTGSDRFTRSRARSRERERNSSRPNGTVRGTERRSHVGARSTTAPGRSRTATRNWSTGTAFAPAPSRQPSSPSRRQRETPSRKQGRLGSRQVVSIRGRQIGSVRVAHRWVKIAGAAVAMLISAIGLTIYLSGVTTQQAFALQDLTSQESQLENQLETLHRDLADKSSASALAKQAAEMNMVVPVQPTVLGPDAHGVMVEQRPGDNTTRPVIDINSQSNSQQTASSRPEDTRNMSDRLAAVPQGERLPQQNAQTQNNVTGQNSQDPAQAPYSPRRQ
ncbi:hypothetical protein GSS88_10205 [Corynebacterium sp. 3HC-13]|uniref:hypothetical protein n=1 Tax=Corynebacterium poyangense TaxID=2684405 RepID=UPI001CC9F385|nr:hypothetical protein [Corynebacterium poyangense]MBZ8178154.1 hypothetical protein [Corynebacterium poyangense]